MILVFFELIVLRWLVLGRFVERSFSTTSVYFYRKWFVDRLMDMSLVILHPVYATLYVMPFLRSLGVKIGHRAEVSTARGINFELTEMGDESFIADAVLVGNAEVRRNMVTLKKTKLNRRAFLGNGSVVPQGTELASNTLVGVLSCAPDIPLKEGQNCFGIPPVLMPARRCCSENHPDYLLYSPSPIRIALRLFIEACASLCLASLSLLNSDLGYKSSKPPINPSVSCRRYFCCRCSISSVSALCKLYLLSKRI